MLCKSKSEKSIIIPDDTFRLITYNSVLPNIFFFGFYTQKKEKRNHRTRRYWTINIYTVDKRPDKKETPDHRLPQKDPHQISVFFFHTPPRT